MRIGDTLDRARRLFGGREAVVDGDTRLTYAQLADRVDQAAGALAARGVRPGERVAALMRNGHRYLEVYFAAERVGAALVPLNYRLAPAELAAILADAEPSLLVLDGAFAGLLDTLAAATPSIRTVALVGEAAPAGVRHVAVIDYEEALAGAVPATVSLHAWGEDEMAHLYYTSGSSGRAKGVMLSQRNVMANAMNMLLIGRFTADDVYLHATPMFHLADAWAGWTVTWIGATHVFMPEFDPRRALELIEAERVTVTHLVPTTITFIVNVPGVRDFDLRSLRLIMFGASPMPVDRLREAMTALGCQFTQLYGMTETSPIATQLPPEAIVTDGEPRLVARLASCGREIPGVRVRVVRADGGDVAPGEVGEIVMRGPTVMLGYWRQPELTAEALRGGWMHSGDLAVVDDEGYITIVDRKKDMIITGGENVYSTEVESALYRHPAVLEAAVVAAPDERWGERVHAVVVLRAGAAVGPADLREFCRAHIAGYKLPRSFAFVAELPKTGSGKVQKAALREALWRDERRRVH